MFIVRSVCLLACLFSLATCSVSKTQTKRPGLHQLFGRDLVDAAAQYKILMRQVPENQFPKNFDPESGKHEWSSSEWWCSGFYPGSLLLLFEETKDSSLYREASRMLKLLEKEQYNRTTHDLGFMMYCSFGNANRLQPQAAYNEILMNSARSLVTRFNPVVGSIRSWDSNPKDFLVIIDNMMNLELLFWATRYSGDSSYYKIAVTHANNTIKNHFRPDFSSYHVINYDPVSGVIREKKTAQGYSNESAWARGQAWGLYGFVMSYRETRDPAYLDQAEKIAGFLLNHSNLPADKIPYWDFNAPDIPNAMRDASAAAIMASALLELQALTTDRTKSRFYFTSAETILTSLSGSYKASPGTNGGFILKHGVGHLPNHSEVNVALTYADFYFIEALKRWRSR
ncbi:MAG: glycoside hydrolase family 88 protein [Flavisolibacter sp.]